MNHTLKTTLSIIGLLAIGFLAGYQTHMGLVKKRVHRIAKERIAPGLMERMTDILDVTDEQRPRIEPIMETYTKKLIEVKKEGIQKRKPIIEALRKELKEELEPEQLERLDHMMERMKREHPVHKRHKRKKRGEQVRTKMN